MIINSILLAAGASSRFGSNKLLHQWQGKPLIMHTIEKLQQLPLNRRYVVSPNNRLAQLAKEADLEWIPNNEPQRGLSHSIALAVEQSSPCDGYLFLVGDQPMLSMETLQALISYFESGHFSIVCAGDNSHYGNPCLISHHFTHQLAQLTGDTGAKLLIRQHLEQTYIYPVSHAYELWDIDTPQSLLQLENMLSP